MIANRWYSIAQTTVFDTSCGINITFGESSSVLFTASVKYGVSSLNISSCSIEGSYNISVRLRETESKWCVDLLSNIEINPTIDITDSPYWVADNSLAGNGAVIAIIENISKEFNTTGGGGSGEGGESLFDRINIGTDANPQYAVVPKDFNGRYVHIVSRGDVLAGGEGTPGEPGQGATTLGGLNNVDAGADETYNTDKVLVKPSLGSHWIAIDLSSVVGLDTNALERYLTTNNYATTSDIETAIGPVSEKVNGFDDRIAILESLGLSLVEQDGTTYLKSEHSFCTEKDIFAGGLGEEGPSSGGIIQQVYGASAFGGAFDSNNLTDTFNAHAINSLYKDIQILKNSGGGGVADSVDWANVYNKPTTLGGYGITDALSKSGGTINGMLTVKRDATVPLYVHTSVDSVYTFMRFKINSINRASIGARRDNEYLYRSNTDLSSNYKIYDEGNLFALKSPFSLIINNSVGTSQITYDGSAAATLTLTKSMVGLGNVENIALSTWKGTSNITTVGTISSGTWNGTAITNTYINSVAWGKITSKPTTVSGYGITDMGSQTVASADKLTTARSIWGNSFNGMNDINGVLLMPNNVAISSQSSSATELECIKVSSSNNLRIGYGISAVGGNTNIYGNKVILRYSSANTTGISLEDNGNVLIGTATDNGGKLQVAGSIRTNGEIILTDTTGSSNISHKLRFLRKTSTDSAYDFGLYAQTTKGLTFFRNLSGTDTDIAYLDNAGSLVATGDITAGSDARYKRIESYAEIDINTIANAPIINFKWTDREDDRVHLGSTAQYWANTSLCNGVIPTTDEKLWTMNYGAIALGGLVSVAKKVVNHEERIAVLERENKELREELKQYRRA